MAEQKKSHNVSSFTKQQWETPSIVALTSDETHGKATAPVEDWRSTASGFGTFPVGPS